MLKAPEQTLARNTQGERVARQNILTKLKNKNLAMYLLRLNP